MVEGMSVVGNVMLSLMNVDNKKLTTCLVQPIRIEIWNGEVMYFGCFALGVRLVSWIVMTYCCRPTPPCLFGGVLPYYEVTGHPGPVPH